MMNIIISTSNSGIRIRYALRIVKSYKEHISTLYSCAKSLHDTELIEALNRRGINGERVPIPDFPSLVFSDVKQVSIVDNTTIVSELLASLAERIDASIFFCAVGFAYKSGLRMILPIIDAVSNRKGNIELVIGSLQDYCNGFINKRMDRDSAKFIQKLLTNQEVDVYAYADAFYHGKFYYISNGIQTFALIGSSNISKTAYLNNYELNLLLEFEKNSNADKTIMLWYNSFKESCEKIENLDIDKFEEFVWNGIQDTISAVSAKKETIGGVRERISHLTDEETKYRLNLWLKYEPSDIYSNLNIDALANYMVFIYPEHELAVFESFELNNAYYTFHYTDFEELMQQVSALSKTQMLIASNFLGRGYHIQEKERLEERINKYFQKSHQFNI